MSEEANVRAMIDRIAKVNFEMMMEVCVKVISKAMEGMDINSDDRNRYALDLIKEVLAEEGYPKKTKRYVEEDNQCIQILKTGKNKGNRCNLSRKKGTDYCSRHLKMIQSLPEGDANYEGQKTKLFEQIMKDEVPSFFQYGDSDVYVEKNHNLVSIQKPDGSYVVGGILVNEDLMELNANAKVACRMMGLKWDHNEFNTILKVIGG
jgi:prolyl-tRNA synthetase